jgi:hypothetical protein
VDAAPSPPPSGRGAALRPRRRVRGRSRVFDGSRADLGRLRSKSVLAYAVMRPCSLVLQAQRVAHAPGLSAAGSRPSSAPPDGGRRPFPARAPAARGEGCAGDRSVGRAPTPPSQSCGLAGAVRGHRGHEAAIVVGLLELLKLPALLGPLSCSSSMLPVRRRAVIRTHHLPGSGVSHTPFSRKSPRG